jgi:hypothetical protein
MLIKRKQKTCKTMTCTRMAHGKRSMLLNKLQQVGLHKRLSVLLHARLLVALRLTKMLDKAKLPPVKWHLSTGFRNSIYIILVLLPRD